MHQKTLLIAALAASTQTTAQAQTLALGVVRYTAQDGTAFMLTKNAIIQYNTETLEDTANDPTQFIVDILPKTTSTLQSEARRGILTTPSTLFNATFEKGHSNILALAQLSAKGTTLCGDQIIFGETPPPACNSKTIAHVTCTQTQCGVHGKTKDEKAVFVTIEHAQSIGCSVVVKINTTTGWHPVCTNEHYRLAIEEAGAALHINPDKQYTLAFPPRGASSTEEFVILGAAIISLMLWTSRSYQLQTDNSNDQQGKTVLFAGQMIDIIYTLSFTATYAVSRTGTTLIPIQTSMSAKWTEKPLLIAYLVVTALSPAVATALLLEIPIAKSYTQKRYAVQVARPFIESMLFNIIFFFLPRTAGEALRETIGLFLGTATCVIIARDINIKSIKGCCRQGTSKFAQISIGILIALWTAITLAIVIIALLTPVFIESAGIENENAWLVALLIAVGAYGAGIYASD